MIAAAQDMLDELLAAASPAVRARFEQLTGEQPSGSAASAAGGGCIAQVVSLDTHPRYAADFRALACGQVSAARTSLGMSSDEFAACLGTILGWTPMPGVVECGRAIGNLPRHSSRSSALWTIPASVEAVRHRAVRHGWRMWLMTASCSASSPR